MNTCCQIYSLGMLLWIYHKCNHPAIINMKKYTFDDLGVRLWLRRLYSSSVENQMMEQELILNCLISWIASRFELSESQVDYLLSLSADFRNNLAQELAFTINNHGDIILDKQTDENSSALFPDSVKVTEYESNKIQSDTPQLPQGEAGEEIFMRRMDGQLTIRIYYKLL